MVLWRRFRPARGKEAQCSKLKRGSGKFRESAPDIVLHIHCPLGSQLMLDSQARARFSQYNSIFILSPEFSVDRGPKTGVFFDLRRKFSLAHCGPFIFI
jgi:hypothetical protein